MLSTATATVALRSPRWQVSIGPQYHHDHSTGALVRWHRAGFRRYWRWKSRSVGGRPQIDAELRALIRRMSVDNPLWGAPRACMASCSSSVLKPASF
jgi:hypothetical protein